MTKNIKLMEQRVIREHFRVFSLNEYRLLLIGTTEFFQYQSSMLGPEVVSNKMLVNSKQQLISANPQSRQPVRQSKSSSLSMASSSSLVASAQQDLAKCLMEAGLTDFNFEIKYIKREDVRPVTHLQNRPPMIQKMLHPDELSERSSNEEYDVFEDENNQRQELYHIDNKRGAKMSMNKAVPVSASPSSLPVVVSNPDNISYVASKQGPLRINRPLTAVSST